MNLSVLFLVIEIDLCVSGPYSLEELLTRYRQEKFLGKEQIFSSEGKSFVADEKDQWVKLEQKKAEIKELLLVKKTGPLPQKIGIFSKFFSKFILKKKNF